MATREETLAALFQVEGHIKEYLRAYAYYDGDGAVHTLTETESLIVEDAIRGLLVEQEFLDAIVEWRQLVKEAR